MRVTVVTARWAGLLQFPRIDGGMVRLIGNREITMQKFEQTSLEIRALSDEELDEISGAGIRSFLGKVAKAIKSVFDGDGDVRRPTDRPN